MLTPRRSPSLLAALALALAATAGAVTSARAEETYEGTWASDLAQCKLPQEDLNAPLVISKDRYDQHEAHCTFKSVTPGSANEWKIASECTVEGAAEPYDFTLVVSGDTLTVSDDTGARDLLRCK